MHRGKVDPGVSELPQGNELSRDHVNRPLNRRHKPVAEPFLLCFTLFPSSMKTKAFSEEQEARQLSNAKAYC